MVVITTDQRDVILDAVRAMYTEVASSPERQFHFPTGRAACSFVGYPPELLDRIPASVVESFAGVGYPFAADVIRPGAVVLDVGSGSGTDAFVASSLAGADGEVIALDLTEAMRAKLAANLARHGVTNVRILSGDAEEIPLPDSSVDVVTSNGVLNLVPDKARAMREIFRVLRPGGGVQIADIVLGRTASDACRKNPELWAECIVGAVTQASYLAQLEAAGFEEIELLASLDYFAGSPSKETRDVAGSLGAHAVVLRARRPASGRSRRSGARAPEEAEPVPADFAGEPGHAPAPDRTLDAGTLGCGEVPILVRKELRRIEPGQVLAVRTQVEEAGHELSAWCRMTGHELVAMLPERGARVFHIRRRNS